MNTSKAMLKAVKYYGGTLLIAGIIIFSIGFFGNVSSTLTGIGIGTVMGAIFVFLMGVFFVATEEVLEKTGRRKSKLDTLAKVTATSIKTK
ncbi:hypothetical protein MKX67_12680 [Cytobacillus sp. FSL W7-1323]|uniref:Uncharacterized protein n=1 Tax=Cytobacillus kochii TaxID=859143 RepID=A0A248TN67_9BACI|nr:MULTISPECIES: hypothetical protein [Cytobacillus]ASV69559.1 hypothetical protein CKF48_20940 [Cytobacillus kochii]MDQ0184340.1 Na+/melibiose symporter-like transporter [Cytobacillus kochii]MEA1852484.1 hypothetical protein [Cytobacillus sp. OWB-43]MED1604642.1 hypothetical protein [Cytobacillus kochii]